VWLFGRSSVHLGASGLVYGLVAYVFVGGLLRRDRRAIAATRSWCSCTDRWRGDCCRSNRVSSWETHLSAAAIGVLLAFALRKLDVPPRKRYEWEDAPDEEDVDKLAPASSASDLQSMRLDP
jgi:membrane associated rhomboid family serine protease